MGRGEAGFKPGRVGQYGGLCQVGGVGDWGSCPEVVLGNLGRQNPGCPGVLDWRCCFPIDFDGQVDVVGGGLCTVPGQIRGWGVVSLAPGQIVGSGDLGMKVSFCSCQSSFITHFFFPSFASLPGR